MQEDIDQSLLQRYEIIQKIRKTNNGIIWKAIDRKQHKLVAIKKINPNVLSQKFERDPHPLRDIKNRHHNQILYSCNQGNHNLYHL
ncbi:Mitogen-activated protein kinase 15 [Paramecium bursaria]